ncbi:hypothetical protein BHE74_00011435 [Ensete ventricosum]|nr:hypothetical protein BHE74_00011435 [Ensete ventricosum]
MEVVGGDGEWDGGEEDEELRPEEDFLQIGEEGPQRAAPDLGHQRQVRLLAQRRRRHVVGGAAVPVVHLLAQPPPASAFEVARLHAPRRLVAPRCHARCISYRCNFFVPNSTPYSTPHTLLLLTATSPKLLIYNPYGWERQISLKSFANYYARRNKMLSFREASRVVVTGINPRLQLYVIRQNAEPVVVVWSGLPQVICFCYLCYCLDHRITLGGEGRTETPPHLAPLSTPAWSKCRPSSNAAHCTVYIRKRTAAANKPLHYCLPLLIAMVEGWRKLPGSPQRLICLRVRMRRGHLKYRRTYVRSLPCTHVDESSVRTYYHSPESRDEVEVIALEQLAVHRCLKLSHREMGLMLTASNAIASICEHLGEQRYSWSSREISRTNLMMQKPITASTSITRETSAFVVDALATRFPMYSVPAI